ncbi:MAG: sulfur carrier protein [Thermoleophilaceae bacterium]|nr:sulfur carrier protein [Thermoleophilaceae bacterium]
MTIWLNGEERDLPTGVSLAQAIEAAGAPPGRRGIAVALDGEVVPRQRWDVTELADGQHIEVVTAVQGG